MVQAAPLLEPPPAVGPGRDGPDLGGGQPGEGGAPKGVGNTVRVSAQEVIASIESELDAASTSLSVGSAVPGTDLVLERWLGDFALGVRYLARAGGGQPAATGTERSSRLVELKIFQRESTPQGPRLEAGRAAIEALGGIRSPWLGELFDLRALPDSRIVVVVEHLSDTTMATELAMKPIEPARLVGILRQAAKGLAQAHRAGVVHGNIKPSAFHLTARDGRPDGVRLGGFGVAALLGGEESSRGTPYYTAPERIRGERPVPANDQYSLGCVAYEALTGVPPFRADTVEQVRQAHLELPPKPPSVVAGHDRLPDPIIAVILRCLRKDPSERFESMEAFEVALVEAATSADLRSAWDDLPVPVVDSSGADSAALTSQVHEGPGTPAAVEPDPSAKTNREAVATTSERVHSDALTTQYEDDEEAITDRHKKVGAIRGSPQAVKRAPSSPRDYKVYFSADDDDPDDEDEPATSIYDAELKRGTRELGPSVPDTAVGQGPKITASGTQIIRDVRTAGGAFASGGTQIIPPSPVDGPDYTPGGTRIRPPGRLGMPSTAAMDPTPTEGHPLAGASPDHTPGGTPLSMEVIPGPDFTPGGTRVMPPDPDVTPGGTAVMRAHHQSLALGGPVLRARQAKASSTSMGWVGIAAAMVLAIGAVAWIGVGASGAATTERIDQPGDPAVAVGTPPARAADVDREPEPEHSQIVVEAPPPSPRAVAPPPPKPSTPTPVAVAPSHTAASTPDPPADEPPPPPPPGSAPDKTEDRDGDGERAKSKPKSKPRRSQSASRDLAKRGHAAINAGRRSEARELFQQALAANARNGSALSGMATLHFDKGEIGQALGFARRAVRASPKNGTYRLQLGDVYFKQGNREAARAEYEKALSMGQKGATKRLQRLGGKKG